jgi:hypothetical protein
VWESKRWFPTAEKDFFFSEEKKQKTFMSWSGFSPAASVWEQRFLVPVERAPPFFKRKLLSCPVPE